MVIAQRLSDTYMRSAIAISMLMCMLVLVPATAEPSVVTMQQSSDEDPEQPREGNTTMRIYSDGGDCWTHFNDNDTEGNGASEEEPYLEEYRKTGTLDVDIWCDMEPKLETAFLLSSDGVFGGSIQLELGGHWTNGQEGCSGGQDGNCENLNLSLYRGTSEFFRKEYPSLSDGMNNVQLNDAVNPEYLEFEGSSNNLQVRFEMTINGDKQDGTWFNPSGSGEEAIFRLYLGNNSTVEWPIDDASWEKGFVIGDEGGGDNEDTPGFTMMLAMAAAAAGAVTLKKRKE